MNNKGQELSLTTIILAALGLIILVVLAAVFTGRIGGFGLGLGQIQQQAQCRDACVSESAIYKGGSFKATCDAATEQQSNLVVDPDRNRGWPCCCVKA